MGNEHCRPGPPQCHRCNGICRCQPSAPPPFNPWNQPTPPFPYVAGPLYPAEHHHPHHHHHDFEHHHFSHHHGHHDPHHHHHHHHHGHHHDHY